MPGQSFSTIFVPNLDPNEWTLKNCLHSVGLNPGPLSHESSVLTIRPRLLASGVLIREIKKSKLYYNLKVFLTIIENPNFDWESLTLLNICSSKTMKMKTKVA
jgi:hypothetical protein